MTYREDDITTVAIPDHRELQEHLKQVVPMEDLYRMHSGNSGIDPLYIDEAGTAVDLTKVTIPEYVFRTGWGEIAERADDRMSARERKRRQKQLRRAQQIQAHGKHLHVFTTWELMWMAVAMGVLSMIFAGAMVGFYFWLLSQFGL